MKATNMIPKDFSAAVKNIKLAILQSRAWLSCFKIRSLPANVIRHSASDKIRQMASAEMGSVIRPTVLGESVAVYLLSRFAKGQSLICLFDVSRTA